MPWGNLLPIRSKEKEKQEVQPDCLLPRTRDNMFKEKQVIKHGAVYSLCKEGKVINEKHKAGGPIIMEKKEIYELLEILEKAGCTPSQLDKLKEIFERPDDGPIIVLPSNQGGDLYNDGIQSRGSRKETAG